MQPYTYMQMALDAAWHYQGLTFPNPAVGCTIVGENGAILAIGTHQKAGGPHAEVVALKHAYRVLSGDKGIDPLEDSFAIHDYLLAHHKGIFHGCTLYVTLEPCAHYGKTPSCALLIRSLQLQKVVIAHEDPNEEAAGGATLLQHAGIAVEMGLLREKAQDLLHPFIQWQQGSFLFFKWAQRLDGSVDGGTISSDASRRLVHGMRDVCDLLVIGGQTVRTDRPLLDARMVGGKAPDVLIYSRTDDFDRSIPLFSVLGRQVMVSDSLDGIDGYKNVMIEGGPGMLAAVENRADAFVSFIAPQSGGTIPFTKNALQLRMMHSQVCGDDILIWLKGK